MADEKTPVISQELADAQKALEAEKARNQEAQKKLTEIATEKASIEARMREISEQTEQKKVQHEFENLSAQAESILAKAATDPKLASQELARLLKETENKSARSVAEQMVPKLKEYVDKVSFVEKMRAGNPEYKEYETLMTPAIEKKVKEDKMSIEDAIQSTLKEFEPLVKKAKTNIPVPAGAGGYMGANPVPSYKPASEAENENVSIRDIDYETQNVREEIAARSAVANKKHRPSI